MIFTDEEFKMSITDFLATIWSLRWLLIELAVVGCVAGYAFSANNAGVYETRASMIVTTETATGTYANGTEIPSENDIRLALSLSKTVQVLATSNRVLEEVVDTDGLRTISIDSLKERIKVTEEDGTAFLWLSLTWENYEQAPEILNRLMEILPVTMLDVMNIGSVNVIDTASLPINIECHYVRNSIIGTIMGIMFAIIIGVIAYLFIPKVHSEDSIDSLNLPVIGRLPQLASREGGVASYLEQDTLTREYGESVGRLAAVLDCLTVKNDDRVIAITSSISGEGKSTVAYKLALRLTESGKRVLLLDFDFKKCTLYKFVRQNKPIDGDTRQPRTANRLPEQVERMYNGIYTIQGFSERDILYSGDELCQAIRSLKKVFDYILIDTPPVGVLSDVQQMHGLVDAALLIVRQDMIALHTLEESKNFLEQAGIPILGTVLNGYKRLGIRDWSLREITG